MSGLASHSHSRAQSDGTDFLVIELAQPDDFDGFRQAARVLLALGVQPHAVRWRWCAPWSRQMQAQDLFASDGAGSVAGRALTPDELDQIPLPTATALRLGRTQLSTLRLACCHEREGRFALCYRWLYRLQAQASLRHDALDSDWREIERLAKAVGREIHKMHAFVRFRPLQLGDAGQTGQACDIPIDMQTDTQINLQGDMQVDMQIAWFEPEHHVLRAASGFFRRRFPNMRWAILTPQCSVFWDLEQLQMAAGCTADQAPGPDAGEQLWLSYYRATFNPARLKEQAMQREMPRKYWKNLPEAVLISELIAGARRRTQRMLAPE